MTGVDRLRDGGPFDRARRVREILSEAGTLGSGGTMTGVPPSPDTAFEDAVPVEGDVVRSNAVQARTIIPGEVGFCDGVQRFAVEGWVGVCPVIRAHVSAAVLLRKDRLLEPVVHRAEEFLVAPLDELGASVTERIREVGLPLLDIGRAARRHPMLDVRRAVQVIHGRRSELERAVAGEFRARFSDAWIVLDGGLRGYEDFPGNDRLLGVIKSHETQYLAGADLNVALTLPAEHRTTVFERRSGDAGVHSWYLRLWDWEGHDLLYGLLRLERQPVHDISAEADRVSGWILAERVPLAGRSRRWDRFLYPIHQVEAYLNARTGAWA